MVVTVIGTF